MADISTQEKVGLNKRIRPESGEREREIRNEIQDAVDVPEYKYTRRELPDNTYIMTGPGARPKYKSRSCYSRERKAGRIAEEDSADRANAIPLIKAACWIMARRLDEELANAYEWSSVERASEVLGKPNRCPQTSILSRDRFRMET